MLLQSTINEEATRRFLSNPENNWPTGLQDLIVNDLRKVPFRYFILDDSSSMKKRDGYKMEKAIGDDSEEFYTLVETSRWKELRHTMNFILSLMQESGTRGQVRFLNQESVLISPDFPENVERVKEILQSPTKHGTPLCQHVRDVVQEIEVRKDELRRSGQRIVIVIVTDGRPTDGDLMEVLRPLENLPCKIVVRLCTNSDRLVSFWNDICGSLELPLDVIDDYISEAKEVREKNPWLTYGPPLHMAREFGVRLLEISKLDEIPLEGIQKTSVVRAILGGNIDSYPHISIDPTGLWEHVNSLQMNEHKVFDAATWTMQPWIKPSLVNAIVDSSP